MEQLAGPRELASQIDTLLQVNLKATAQDIINKTGAHECEIIAQKIAGIHYNVAYIVAHDSPLSNIKTTSAKLLEKYGLNGIFTINHMPLTANGERDIEALKSLIPPLPKVLEHIEADLKSQEGVIDAAALALSLDKKPDRFYIKSLLPIADPTRESSQGHGTKKPTQAITEIPKSDKPALQVAEELPSPSSMPKTLGEMLVTAANQYSNVKITYLDDTGKATEQGFSDLLDQARQIRNGIFTRNISVASHAIIHAYYPAEILPIFWGCILAGVIPVITPVPPTYTENNSEVGKLKGVWELLEQPLIIGDTASLEGVTKSSDIPQTSCVNYQSLMEPLEGSSTRDIEVDENSIAFLSLSSGSTGTPKCIQLTHRNVLVRGRGTNILCGNTAQDRILNWLPFDHIGSISDWHIRCLDLGCDMIYCNKERILPNPLEWLNLISQYRITHTWAPNFAYAAVSATLKNSETINNDWDLSSVKSFLTAAESVSPATIAEFVSRLSIFRLNKSAITPAFGMAEMGSGVTYALTDDFIKTITIDRNSLSKNLKLVPSGSSDSVSFTCLGPLVPSMSMRIADEQGALLPELRIGNLHMQGACVSPGYYKNSEANKVFLDDGWMDTGDKGFIFKGELYLSGRSKDTIIIGGANYLPVEIEKVAETVDGVLVSYVAATAVKPRSDENESLAIFFSTLDDDLGNNNDILKIAQSIRESVAQNIGISPEYLIPLPKNKIPKTAIGKIQRSKLVQQMESGEFDNTIRTMDMLLENNRTLPDWFASKQWVRANRVPLNNQQSLLMIVQEGNTKQIAENIKESIVNNGIDTATIKTMSELIVISENNKSIEVLNHCHIVDLRFIDIDRKCNDSQAIESKLNGIQQLAKIISNYSNIKHSKISLIIPEHANDKLDSTNLFYSSLPALYHSVFYGIEGLNISSIHYAETIDNNAALIQNIADELNNNCSDHEILLKDNIRYISRLISYEAIKNKSTLNNITYGGLYVITGGLGGVGQELCLWLIKHFQANIIIIGRSDPSGNNNNYRNKQAALNEIKAFGNVHYLSADISQIDTIESQLIELEGTLNQTIDGFFHLAGAVKEIPFIEDTTESMLSVLTPKVNGALTIHQLLSKRPQSLAVYFSSSLSTIPSNIAPVYSLANRQLDLLALHEQNQGLNSYSIAWSSWEELGMSKGGAPASMLNAQGLYTIPPYQGLSSLHAILCRPPENVLVGINRYSKILESKLYERAKLKQEVQGVYVCTNQAEENIYCSELDIPTTALTEIPRKKNVDKENDEIDIHQLTNILNGREDFVEPSSELQATLLEVWKKVLKVEQISITDNFFSLGGHSLMAAELINLINSSCASDLSLSVIFEAPTIEEQSALIDKGDHSDSTQVIPLQEKGTDNPIFCLCGIELYKDLADSLAPSIPTYGVYLPIEGKLVDSKEQLLDVRTMAEEYIEGIKTVQPSGPYRLLGISFGAALAYEVAGQLKKLGETVECIVLIDFVLKDQPLKKIVNSRRISYNNITAFFDSAILSTKNTIKELLMVMPFIGNKVREKYEPSDSRQVHYKRAWRKYEPTMESWGNADSVLVFKSKDQPHIRGYSKVISCGWEQYMDNIPKSYLIPGDHLGVLKQPNANNIATIIKQSLYS
ncbi:MAG: KR domain-containing protein [Cellvibrionaceae bacterium]